MWQTKQMYIQYYAVYLRKIEMTKFLKRLIVSWTGEEVPKKHKLRSVGFEHKVSEYPISDFDRVFVGYLKYENKIHLGHDVRDAENIARQRLRKDIEWQIYGEIRQLTQMAISNCMKEDLEGVLVCLESILEELND